MTRLLAVGMLSLMASAFGATTSKSTWQIAEADISTDPVNPTSWLAAGAWDKVPSGATDEAYVFGDIAAGVAPNKLTGKRYVRIPEPITLGKITAAGYNNDQAEATAKYLTFVSEFPVTIADATYQVSGSRWFADFVTPNESVAFGVAGNMYVAGRINSSYRITLAGGVHYHHMDRYAYSSSEDRTDDWTTKALYRGSGALYVFGPRNGEAHAETWTVTAGSPVVTRTAMTPAIAPGAIVTCGDVFPEGTFVKYVFEENVIELSAPARSDVQSGEMTLAFAAIRPRGVLRIPVFQNATWAPSFTSFMKASADTDFRVEVDDLYTMNKDRMYPLILHCLFNLSTPPAPVVFHDAAGKGTSYHADAYMTNLEVRVGRSHVEFAETGRAGARPGFPQSTVTSYTGVSTVHSTTFTVTNNLSAAIGALTNITHEIVKDGAGELEILKMLADGRNVGTLVVKEGTMTLPQDAWFKTVAVSNGATLNVVGEFAPETFSYQKGARIGGGGTLVLKESAPVADLVFVDGTGVRIAGGCGELLTSAPVAEVVGTPAFWVDARNSKMTFKDDDGVTVTRIDDVRKTSDADDYMYAATEVFGSLPVTLVKDGDGVVNHLQFVRTDDATPKFANIHELGWSRAVTNICAVFQVQVCQNGGGQFLGATTRAKTGTGHTSSDWVRDGGTGYVGDIFYRGNASGTIYQKALLKSPLYVNGMPRDPLAGYPYQGTGVNCGSATPARTIFAPHVTDVHPTLPMVADCFATDDGFHGRNGNKRLCELIVYTNALSYAERVKVAGWLMRKWVGCEINYETCSKNGLDVQDLSAVPTLTVGEGENLYVAGTTGAGELVKRGAGSLLVEDLHNANADVHVAGGTLTVNSRPAVTADDLPADPYFRMDAAATDKMTIADGGVVSAWQSSSGSLSWNKWTSNRSPILKEDQLNGLPMVDMGPARLAAGNPTAFVYEKSNRIKSLFMVQDTAQGGTTLLGNKTSWSYEGIFRDGWYPVTDASYQPSNPLVYKYTSGAHADLSTSPDASRVWLNGDKVANPTTTGFTGGADILSFVSYIDISSDCFCYNNGMGQYTGGGMLGEYIVYERGLNDRDVRKIEAYLDKKWFNRDTAAFTPAVAGNVTVDAGATLQVVGGAPLTAKSLSGSGTIAGAGVSGLTALTANKSGALTVGGTVTFGDAVVVTASFDTTKAKDCVGLWPLVTADGFANLDFSKWTFGQPMTDRVTYSFRVVGDTVCLSIEKKGSILILR